MVILKTCGYSLIFKEIGAFSDACGKYRKLPRWVVVFEHRKRPVVSLPLTQVLTRHTEHSLYLWCAALLLRSCMFRVSGALPWIPPCYNFNRLGPTWWSGGASWAAPVGSGQSPDCQRFFVYTDKIWANFQPLMHKHTVAEMGKSGQIQDTKQKMGQMGVLRELWFFSETSLKSGLSRKIWDGWSPYIYSTWGVCVCVCAFSCAGMLVVSSAKTTLKSWSCKHVMFMFYPHGASDAWVIAIILCPCVCLSVCVSVCHTPVLYQNG